jgi:hypothetical protein
VKHRVAGEGEGAMDTKVGVTSCRGEVTMTSINYGHQVCRSEEEL